MKKTKAFRTALLFVLAFAMILGAMCCTFCNNDIPTAEAYGTIYDMLSPELISIYETEIAGEPIVSKLGDAKLQRTADRLEITVAKLKAIMLLQDLCARVGEDITLSRLATMKDFALIKLAKEQAEKYAATLPETRRSELKEKFLAAIKKG